MVAAFAEIKVEITTRRKQFSLFKFLVNQSINQWKIREDPEGDSEGSGRIWKDLGGGGGGEPGPC